MSEKTEQPSAKRLREARRKGQLPRSRLLASASVSLGGLMGLGAGWPAGSERLRTWTAHLLLEQRSEGAWQEALTVAAALCGPALLGALLASLTVSVAVAGFSFHPEHVAPQLERISPAAGLKRLFSTRQIAEVGKALLLTAVVGALFVSALRDEAADAVRASWLAGPAALGALLGRLEPLVVRVAWGVLALGGMDYVLARRRHVRELMMTRDELKREYKESEGDPHHKGQRKALHRQLAQGGPARGLQKATAVVVNPTHIAVALRYDAAECEAPYLVAKAREDDALALRREAARLGIPVVRDIPLARSLIHYDVGEEIPAELYEAAAAVLRVALGDTAADGSPRRQTP
ncbi:EscU/YscU/HrcU family type III secretion system export apparatus switch protein [Aggregicoccus sp. 17bor-14]|uniref:EscU/YscU/HrcU family type III secretion system export apparatus switch protein n=1 Tax=Myxococcaceae TaxID=31 RepID=UPI00129CB479|nr:MULTISPECIES: EscU/YscU/HrcU family type III secretion system export apparatus switch protein [Myxococcaceae]MBF5044375.1 EscU/YscU/HrcU family type III secretion system export apparatus switch protein [Simulacricoccus sp. 17bor-14]MRI90122.1 EscU/YscU/HrcU family type III secretion system export apparatus switch protein [Aggregicoccus sp. 17bor-14]